MKANAWFPYLEAHAEWADWCCGVQAEDVLHEVASQCELEGLGHREEEGLPPPLSRPLPREGPLAGSPGGKPAAEGGVLVAAEASPASKTT